MQKYSFIVLLSFFCSMLIAQEKEFVNTPTSVAEEFRVKREEVFEFAQKPQITKEGNVFNISFESKGFCDVTIAIENSDGKIIRHLVSGVLGPKAPAPLQKNSKSQKIIWDGKDDQEVYVKDADRDACIIRVSLGLKPQFERTMFWSPKKRIGFNTPVIKTAPEGVYIGESSDLDQVRLFDHQGNYIRTVFPFPADKIDKVKDLKMHPFIQDGKLKPLKRGDVQSNLLTLNSDVYGAPGIMAVGAGKGQVAVTGLNLNRLAEDGSSAGLSVYGPKIAISRVGKEQDMMSPRSLAFSPDGKWLYLAGYSGIYGGGWGGVAWINAVTRMPYDGSEPPTLWAGDLTQGKTSAEEGKFRMPTSIACDVSGRVYVSDYMNNRIQIFDAEGKHLKSIPTNRPAYVAVHQKTGDVYVFSYLILENGWNADKQDELDATMTHFGPFDNPVVKNKCALPLTGYNKTTSWNTGSGFQHKIDFDSWAEKPTIWIINGQSGSINKSDDGSIRDITISFDGGCAQLFEEVENKLVPKQNFADDIRKTVTRINPPILWRQRLAVNHATGKLYVLEGDSGVMKSVNQLVELSPDTGAIKLVDLPMGGEDFCFDINGLAYIRTDIMIARYDPSTWREVPFDYGIEKDNHSFGMGAKAGSMISAILTPGHRSFNFWHMGGIDVNVKGHIVATTCNGFEMDNSPQWHPGEAHFKYESKPYKPGTYPGRMRWGEIHIWDKYGKLLKEDAVPGMGHLNGIGLDQDDNIYMLTAATRIIDGKQTDPALGRDASGTVLKVLANKNKTYSAGNNIPVPLPEAQKPKRSIDISGYTTGWVEGAEWLYGGIGLNLGTPCICWNSRFSKDFYNRSFAPETRNYSVAVIDSSGNLILRVGKYGNVDDGKPLIPEGGPTKTNSIGGDEVGLFYACYVASHTDKRLFIADAGNTRILSVKLGYYVEEKIILKDVPNKK
jgi:DNA-binding beta-propeller fold protein YncE